MRPALVEIGHDLAASALDRVPDLADPRVMEAPGKEGQAIGVVRLPKWSGLGVTRSQVVGRTKLL